MLITFPNLQATDITKEFVGQKKFMNYQYTPDTRKKAHVRKIYYVIFVNFTHIQFGVNLHTHTHVEDIYDMLIKMS